MQRHAPPPRWWGRGDRDANERGPGPLPVSVAPQRIERERTEQQAEAEADPEDWRPWAARALPPVERVRGRGERALIATQAAAQEGRVAAAAAAAAAATVSAAAAGAATVALARAPAAEALAVRVRVQRMLSLDDPPATLAATVAHVFHARSGDGHWQGTQEPQALCESRQSSPEL